MRPGTRPRSGQGIRRSMGSLLVRFYGPVGGLGKTYVPSNNAGGAEDSPRAFRLRDVTALERAPARDIGIAAVFERCLNTTALARTYLVTLTFATWNWIARWLQSLERRAWTPRCTVGKAARLLEDNWMRG